jgi:hypothetical protein
LQRICETVPLGVFVQLRVAQEFSWMHEARFREVPWLSCSCSNVPSLPHRMLLAIGLIGSGALSG